MDGTSNIWDRFYSDFSLWCNTHKPCRQSNIRPETSAFCPRNDTKTRVWLLNNSKVIHDSDPLSTNRRCSHWHRWSTKLDKVNNQGRKKTIIKRNRIIPWCIALCRSFIFFFTLILHCIILIMRIILFLNIFCQKVGGSMNYDRSPPRLP